MHSTHSTDCRAMRQSGLQLELRREATMGALHGPESHLDQPAQVPHGLNACNRAEQEAPSWLCQTTRSQGDQLQPGAFKKLACCLLGSRSVDQSPVRLVARYPFSMTDAKAIRTIRTSDPNSVPETCVNDLGPLRSCRPLATMFAKRPPAFVGSGHLPRTLDR